MNGTFVVSGDTVYQLQDDFDDNEYQAGSKATLASIEATIAAQRFSDEKAKALLDQHAKARQELKGRWKERPDSRWYPAGKLPSDAVLVVRNLALADFIARLAGDRSPTDASVGKVEPNDRQTLLRVIGALLEILMSKTPAGKPGKYAIESQSDVVALIDGLNKGVRGLGDSTVPKRFAEANVELARARQAAGYKS